MADSKSCEGGCHCGQVRFRATADVATVVECNCSICAKRGALWAFVQASQFILLKGQDALTDYQFGQKRIHHRFCALCGIGSFSHGLAPTGEETYAVNVRCLDGVDVAALPRKPFDGKSL
jgi:hypothetical protein